MNWVIFYNKHVDLILKCNDFFNIFDIFKLKTPQTLHFLNKL